MPRSTCCARSRRQPDHPLLALDNVIVTPHAAFYSDTAIAELQTKAATNVASVLTRRAPATTSSTLVCATARPIEPACDERSDSRGAPSMPDGVRAHPGTCAVPRRARAYTPTARTLASTSSRRRLRDSRRGPRAWRRVVAKQALARLRVEDDWTAKPERTEHRGRRDAPLRSADARPRAARARPRPSAHVVVMELLPDDARNWQSGDRSRARARRTSGDWAGETLGTVARAHGGRPGGRRSVRRLRVVRAAAPEPVPRDRRSSGCPRRPTTCAAARGAARTAAASSTATTR